MSNTGDLISRVYANFRGVDFRGDEINIVRSPDSLNVWKNYKKTSSIETRPGMELLSNFDDTVYGLFFYKDLMIVHSGTKLYKVTPNSQTTLFTGVREAISDAFIFNDIWYFKDGKNFIQYDGIEVKEIEGYVPTTSIGRTPKWEVSSNNSGGGSGGSILEDFNLLSDYRINTFVGYEPVGASTHQQDQTITYFLDTTNIDEDFEPIIMVDGKVWEKDKTYSTYRRKVDYERGCISFPAIYSAAGGPMFPERYEYRGPTVPATDGQDNVSIKFKKKVSGEREKIYECTLLQVFDNRVFVSGNPDHPNTIWHCSLNDPTYWSDLDYYREGVDRAQIKGIVAGNNALWVFREPSDANTSVFYHTPTVDTEYGKIYPSVHSSITTGCVGKAVNFNDDIIFFSERGMEGISGDVTTEQVIGHRSSLVDRKLIAEKDYTNMILEEWEGYLLIIIGDKIYLADSRTAFTNEDHIEYEFFYWQMEKKITSARVNNGILYLGTDEGVYTLTDTKCNIESFWTTPKDKFQAPHKLKTTNKRGCVAEATGDISVYAKTEDTDFELIGTYENVTDYFVSRIKKKKFKDIQLKFHSKTRFSLETVTLECFIGGYIKR